MTFSDTSSTHVPFPICRYCRPYHKSFYHKTTGNPDVPIGGTTLSYCPWGTLRDVEQNTQRHLSRHEDRLQEVGATGWRGEGKGMAASAAAIAEGGEKVA